MLTRKKQPYLSLVSLSLVMQLTGCIVDAPSVAEMTDTDAPTLIYEDLGVATDLNLTPAVLVDDAGLMGDGFVEPDASTIPAPDLSFIGQCTPGETRICGDDIGQCQSVVQVCSEFSQWPGQCPDGAVPSIEICDGLDNDCDGQADETFNLGIHCIVALDNGHEVGGETQCQTEPSQPNYLTIYCEIPMGFGIDEDGDGADQLEDCDDTDENNAPGGSEVCDGADNDCDGRVDEGVERACGGFDCQFSDGQQTCSEGRWGVCISDDDGLPCECLPGYEFDDNIGRCRDIDECDGMENPCAGTCENTGGSYRCICPAGEILAEDGQSCMGSYCEAGSDLALTGDPLNIATHLFELCDQDIACCQSCDWLTQCQITQRRCPQINDILEGGEISEEATRQFHLFQCLTRCNGNQFVMGEQIFESTSELRNLCQAAQCDQAHHLYMTMSGDNRQTCNGVQ